MRKKGHPGGNDMMKWRVKRKRALAAGAKRRADQQVRQQHRICERRDIETRRAKQGRLHEHGEDRGSPESINKWFRQARCVPQPAAVIMSHWRAMPDNVNMFLGTCRCMTEDIRNCQLFVDHGFVPLALNVMRKHQRIVPGWKRVGSGDAKIKVQTQRHIERSQKAKATEARSAAIRQALYLPLSIIAQRCGDVLVVEGAVELLVRELRGVVREIEWKRQCDSDAANERSSTGETAVPSPKPMAYTTQAEFQDIVRTLILILDVPVLPDESSSASCEGTEMQRDEDSQSAAEPLNPKAPEMVREIHGLLLRAERESWYAQTWQNR